MKLNPIFLLKCTALVALFFTAGAAFKERFILGIDEQVVKCIPGTTFYLIDKKYTDITVGNTYAFAAEGLTPLYEDGTLMIKFLRGLEGAKLSLNKDGVFVDGKYESFGFSLAKKMNREESSFFGEGTVEQGKGWFMGTSPYSFDSRYWGTLNLNRVVGRAYPIF